MKNLRSIKKNLCSAANGVIIHAERKILEVKSTKRVTEPDLSNAYWMDSLNITRNEWIAAQQHREFFVFIVYTLSGAGY